ncbi:MAG: hypothetical protein LV481_07785 [Methylacidiphilales bacterium]|nr:hypothetical protein [Candidatus Methylacidiphilales bacterium]
MNRFQWVLLVLPLLLSACGLSDQQKADYTTVQSSGVDSAVYDKMVHGDALGLHDIKALSRAHVRDDVVLRYLRDQRIIYFLSAKDITGLQKAGVSQSIIDYMMQTPQLYGAYGYPPPIALGVGYGPFWGGPYPCWGGPFYYHHWH